MDQSSGKARKPRHRQAKRNQAGSGPATTTSDPAARAASANETTNPDIEHSTGFTTVDHFAAGPSISADAQLVLDSLRARAEGTIGRRHHRTA